MVKQKNAVKPIVKAKSKRGRPASNKRPSKPTVSAKSTKSLKNRLKAKPGRSKIKKGQLKLNKQKSAAKSVKKKIIVNNKRRRSATSKAANLKKALQITEKKVANA